MKHPRSIPTPEQWSLVVAHREFGRTLAHRMSPGKWRPFLGDFEDAALDGLIEAATGHDPARGDFEGFAAVLIRRRIYDRRNFLLRRKRRPDRLVALVEGLALARREAAGERVPFAALVEPLDPAQRDLLAIVFVEGMPVSHAGDRLGLTAWTGRRKFRESLAILATIVSPDLYAGAC